MAHETPNLKIKTVNIKELKSSEYNPRKWSESATEQLAVSSDEAIEEADAIEEVNITNSLTRLPDGQTVPDER